MPRPLDPALSSLPRISRRLVVGAVAAALVGGAAVGAPPSAHAAGTDTELSLTATEATFTSAAQPGKTHDQLSFLSATRTTDHTYLKFDTSAVPSGSRVVSAALELDVTSTRATSGSFEVFPVSSTWAATTLLNTNRPAESAAVDDAVVRATPGKVVVPLALPGATLERPAAAFMVRYSVSGASTKLAKTVKLRVVVSSAAAVAAPPPAPSASGRAFAVPAPNTSAKKVFAHYFPPYPISLDNKAPESDYYARNYLDPKGEGGKHAAYGGLLRDRPLGRAPLSGDWRTTDLKTEVRQAAGAGVDGFTVDIMSLSGRNWDTTVRLMDAAATSGTGFTVVPNIDATASVRTASPEAVAAKLAELYKSPSAHRLADGRYLLSSFKAEGKEVSWWSSIISVLQQKYGVRVAFVAVFLNASDANMAQFAPISYALSNWGPRTEQIARAAADNVARARRLGVKWMSPVAIQDMRPRNGLFAEADNTATLRAMWDRAIDGGADLVQMATWNDYSETTSFAPSVHHGESFLDINAYYLSQFKTGAAPKITGDAVYVSHRMQLAGATSLLGIPLMRPTLGGAKAPARDTVEVLTMLRAPAVVTVTVGGSSKRIDAPAGLWSTTVPLSVGTVSAQATRSGSTIASVTSPFRVQSRLEAPDLQYVAASSTGR